MYPSVTRPLSIICCSLLWQPVSWELSQSTYCFNTAPLLRPQVYHWQGVQGCTTHLHACRCPSSMCVPRGVTHSSFRRTVLQTDAMLCTALWYMTTQFALHKFLNLTIYTIAHELEDGKVKRISTCSCKKWSTISARFHSCNTPQLRKASGVPSLSTLLCVLLPAVSL